MGQVPVFTIDHLIYKRILDIPHLTITPPVTCIVGASGSGKTTLLRHLNRLYVPDSGTIDYQGVSLDDIDPIVLRRQVVMLGQTPVIYSGTIEENLQIGLRFAQKPPATRDTLAYMLEQVGLAQPLQAYCDTLSGGERQRLCLARVLLMDAQTYLLDEPSAALDPQTEQFIIQSLEHFVQSRGKHLIMVTHSQQIAARYADACIRIEKGRIGGAAHA